MSSSLDSYPFVMFPVPTVTLPNFLLIGAAKSGTGSLYRLLGQHPDIYLSPVKEPHFFALEGEPLAFRGPGDSAMINRRAITRLSDYEALFEGASGRRAVGEASVSSLYFPAAAARIRRRIPHARLIAVLRNPVDRAYSSYLYMRLQGYETERDFGTTLRLEEQRIAANWHHIWHYARMGEYFGQLGRYYDCFPRSQIRIYLYEDMASDLSRMIGDVFRFLDVDPQFQLRPIDPMNVSGVPRSRFLHALVERRNPLTALLRRTAPPWIRKAAARTLRRMNLARPPLPEALRHQLVARYREDILRLGDLIERDLSAWIRVPS